MVVVHLKSKIPADVPGQKLDTYTWRSAGAFAEGSFLSAMRRVGQAVEVRLIVDGIFDADASARIVVCGDFNADLNDTAVKAIRGDIEDNGNSTLATRVMAPCEKTVPEPARYSLIHQGRGR